MFTVALQFVHEWQVAFKNYEASRDRSLPVFGVGVAFVDESLALFTKTSDAIALIRLHLLSISMLFPSKACLVQTLLKQGIGL